MKSTPIRSALSAAIAALLFALPLHGVEAAPDPKEGAWTLPKFTVKTEPICSFGIGLVATRDAKTKNILRLVISDVAPGSAASHCGLKIGDEILAINGEKVRGMNGEMKHGSQLFSLLVDQPAGQSINLEVAVLTVTRVTLKATKF